MFNSTTHNPCCAPALNRRALLLLAASGSLLSACGGGHDDGETAHSNGKTQLASAHCVSAGLVGVAVGEVLPAQRLLSVAGMRRQGVIEPIQPDDLFCVGSNTKAMSCAAIGAMVDKGWVTWSTRVADAMPGMAATMHPDYAAITLDQLLNHRAGLPAFAGDADDEQGFLDFVTADTSTPLPSTVMERRAYFARWLLKQTPPAALRPGVDFLYSNAGYALAAAMLEALRQRSFESLFDEVLVHPLRLSGMWRMPSAVADPQPLGHEGLKDVLSVYTATNDDLVGDLWLQVLAPGGFWSCSAPAYSEWLRWNLRALVGQTTPLATAYVKRLRVATADAYTLGWLGTDIEGKRLLAHSGHVRGFMAEAVMRQDGSHAAFGLTNTAYMGTDGSSWVLAELDRQLGSVFL